MATATAPVRSITRFAPTSVRERRKRSGTSGARVARLDQREGSQEHGRAGEQEDRLGVAPADVGRLDERVDEQNERTGDGERPGGVVASPRQLGAALAQEHGRQRERGQAEGDVDEEDPFPAGAVDERAADQPRRGGADAAEPAPDPERLVALGALGEGRGDDRQRGRGHDRGADALDHAGRKQRRRRPGEPAHERRGREEQDTGHEHAPAPEQVGRPSSEQQQAAEGERVGAQHPLQAVLREAEVGSDRGQRHEHDRAVEEHHEKGAAEQRKRPPAARIGNVSCHAH